MSEDCVSYTLEILSKRSMKDSKVTILVYLYIYSFASYFCCFLNSSSFLLLLTKYISIFQEISDVDIQGVHIMFPDFFRIGTFIDSTHMKF